MLVAISDIHLQDTTLSGVPDEANVPPQAFELFFHHVAASARQNRARELIILLNGDIFDFLRTERWFTDGFAGRPYQTNVSETVEAKLLEIWSAIERSNRETLRLLHAVAVGRDPYNFPVRPRFVYVAGNHDRLVNLSPALRRKVHDLFNLDHSDAPLAWTYSAPTYGVFARHGHEYDWANCEYNFTFRRPGAPLDESLYWETPIGDWVTLDIATYLPYRFRDLYADHPLFDHLYRRLRAIDDVRPAAMVVPWLQAEVADSREADRIVSDTLRAVLRERKDDPFMWSWLRSHTRPLRWDRTKVWVPTVRLLPRVLGMLPPRLIRWLSHVVTGRGDRPAWRLAAQEAVLDEPPYQYIVSGHFHQPQTAFLRKVGGQVHIYFRTGSWRHRFERCRQDGRFLQLHAMNYVTFFRPDEDPDHLGRPKTSSFGLWNGLAMKTIEQ